MLYITLYRNGLFFNTVRSTYQFPADELLKFFVFDQLLGETIPFAQKYFLTANIFLCNTDNRYYKMEVSAMGQKEMTRCCRMSGRRCRTNRKRLTKIFTINKGDAIMKKRIIALVLACMLICSIAVTASAATRITYGNSYQSCYYHTYTTCELYHYQDIMELNHTTNGQSELDYNFHSNVRVFGATDVAGGQPLVTIYGGAAPIISTNYSEFEIQLDHIVAFHFVNGVEVGDVTVQAG